MPSMRLSLTRFCHGSDQAGLVYHVRDFRNNDLALAVWQINNLGLFARTFDLAAAGCISRTDAAATL